LDIYGNILTSASSDPKIGLQKFRDTTGSGLAYTFWNIGTNLYFRWAYPDTPSQYVVATSDSAHRSLATFQGLLGGGVYDVGSTYENPMMIDATNVYSSLRNYRLLAGSPARNRCNCSLQWDRDGNPRDPDADGYHDLGAYEYSGTVSIPSTPINLTATALSTSEIALAWPDVSGETGYLLERKTGSGGSWSQIATPLLNSTSYNDIGLTQETTYYYRLRATNTAGTSGYSNEASATTLTPSDPPPPSVAPVHPGKGLGRRR
jgi:hypothetical protein